MPSELDIAIQKKILRRRIRSLLSELPDSQRLAASDLACKRLCSLDEFRQANVLMIFLSLPFEIETEPAILHALHLGKTVAVPVVNWEAHIITPVELKTLDCEMTQDRYGLRSPAQAQPISTDQVDLIVVPGLAFDDNGNRLGQGGGFYDRFLAGPRCKATTCGLALKEQFVDNIPVDVQDVSIHMLVTDNQSCRFNHRK